ncbi:glycosyltransferase family 9 protein [Paraburkholderia sp.]|uniref:glycosyltransferase family 9 protein n=1 Tax=Paraburkholderia sp. TaxID=1926495 RepID=UPI003D6F5B19
MPAFFAEAAPPRTILVICTGRIGDVLLATPVLRSLKSHWPNAQIDMLVFDGTGDVLENNPDIRRVLSIARHANRVRRFADARAMWRRYDLACSLRTSGVASFYCWIAGHKRIGLVPPTRKRWLRQPVLNRFAVDSDDARHVVQSGAVLTALLGIPPSFEVVPPSIGAHPERLLRLDQLLAPAAGKPFVVIHLYPRYVYKMWHAEGWHALVAFLHERGYAIVLTGGSEEAEVAYSSEFIKQAGTHVIDLVGKLSLGATAEVIRRARLFVGPDTATSHVSAATGTPTIALFGPSNPVRWGPWPKDWTGTTPWQKRGSGQQGNVYLLQGVGACVPCKREGCEGHISSRSHCLSTLDANRVIDAVAELLGVETCARN